MSEQINTPKLRFPEFRDEWEIKIIKNCLMLFLALHFLDLILLIMKMEIYLG